MGICGTGMASLAGMLKTQGHVVKGSDQNAYPPMSTKLSELGIEIKTPYQATNLNPRPDLVIIGNAISKNHVEAEAVLQQGIPYLSMAACLHDFFLQDKICLVVAGTHGKTTSTSLLAWVLEYAGLNPSFFVGGIPLNFKDNFKLDTGKYFVIEGDEYDTAFFDKGPKFLHYNPTHVLLTSIEFDHADIYRDLEHLKSSFVQLLEIISGMGSLVANLDFPAVGEVLEKVNFKKTVCYSTRKIASPSWIPGQARDDVDYNDIVFYPEKIQATPDGMCFHLNGVEFLLPMFGTHNVSNAVGVALIAHQIGIDLKTIADAFRTFKGIKRRQEIIGEPHGITIIDDFAHHPTAVRETIASIRARFPNRKIWAVFEPRSNSSKRDVFQKDYPAAFLEADAVLIHDVFMPEKVKDGKVLNVDEVVAQINQQSEHLKAQHLSGIDTIVSYIKDHAKAGDILLIMSNGGFGGIHQHLLNSLI